jgi:hypothetical protein
MKKSELSSEIKEKMKQNSKYGLSPLYLMLIDNKNHKCVDEFLEDMQLILNNDELKHMLMEKEFEFGSTCFLLVSQCSTSECIDTLWRFAKSVMDANELKLFVQQTDDQNQNALQLAAGLNTAEVFEW